MTITLIEANNTQELLLKNMQQLYLHELSEFSRKLDINDDGRYDNHDMNDYLKESHLKPYLIQLESKIIGFLCVNLPPNTPDQYDYFIADLFILKKYRKRGYGQRALETLFDEHHGSYALLVLKENTPALEYLHHFYEKNCLPYDEFDMVIEEENCVFHGFDII